jgi:hypothetical protein
METATIIVCPIHTSGVFFMEYVFEQSIHPGETEIHHAVFITTPIYVPKYRQGELPE